MWETAHKEWLRLHPALTASIQDFVRANSRSEGWSMYAYPVAEQARPDISLQQLISEFESICLSTRGRIRRINRYLMGVDLILSVTPEHLRADAELRLSQIARRCGLVGEPLKRVEAVTTPELFADA